MVCVRIIQWHGRVETIKVPEHVYAYRGRIPCTGPRVCIHCGQFAPESKEDTFLNQVPERLTESGRLCL